MDEKDNNNGAAGKFGPQDLLNQGKEFAKQAAEQADKFYNQLPLDKVSEKLGGKIDFRAKNTKITVAAIAGAVVLLVLIGIFSLLGSLFFGSSSLPEYAPEDTDVIIYVNSAKIVRHELYKELEKDKDFKHGIEDWEKQLKEKKAAFKLEDLTDSEACWFINFNSFTKNNELVLLTKFNSSISRDVIDYFKALAEARKKGNDAYTDDDADIDVGVDIDDNDIDGHPAVIITDKRRYGSDETCLIALSRKMLQMGSARKNAISEPLEKTGLDLADAVDTSALISVAFDVSKTDSDELCRNLELKKYDDLFSSLDFVTLNVCDEGSELAVELVATYGDSDDAERAEKAFKKLLNDAAKEIDDRDTVKTIRKIKTEQKGKKLVVSVSEEVKSIIKFVKNIH